jgi:hypothetical protein
MRYQFLDLFLCLLEERWFDSLSCIECVDHLLQSSV